MEGGAAFANFALTGFRSSLASLSISLFAMEGLVFGRKISALFKIMVIVIALFGDRLTIAALIEID